ncbi:hypothetical protein [Chitinophaga sancti]|uniref:Immunity protein 26 n=1 Tax=Chitinophaga sancti TaxID=1004 RepID=A0A1K1M4Q7_9BACT|nr:hypothetical protein [Chitinophaga sancti]WQD64631.1 hypothetical protein U0033_09515 [Chitinophaga sancti]WQG89746.1 hypothetical protein SR876_32960 [Chitinophaga sancti]SFW18116.1 hypothetical protein SAMN05661012_00446 [Chitinophaga sancti]
MIADTDIRVGNLVWYYDLYMNETAFKIEGILEGYVYNSCLPKSKLPLAKVNPVKLEADQLNALGFVRGEKEYGEDIHVYSYRYTHRDSIYIRDEGYAFQLLAASPAGLVPYGRPLVHVHQLQNLFYDLTAEELALM